MQQIFYIIYDYQNTQLQGYTTSIPEHPNNIQKHIENKYQFCAKKDKASWIKVSLIIACNIRHFTVTGWKMKIKPWIETDWYVKKKKE